MCYIILNNTVKPIFYFTWKSELFLIEMFMGSHKIKGHILSSF